MEKKSLEQSTRDLLFSLETLVIPKFAKAAEDLRKAEDNYRQACEKLKTIGKGSSKPSAKTKSKNKPLN